MNRNVVAAAIVSAVVAAAAPDECVAASPLVSNLTRDHVVLTVAVG